MHVFTSSLTAVQCSSLDSSCDSTLAIRIFSLSCACLIRRLATKPQHSARPSGNMHSSRTSLLFSFVPLHYSLPTPSLPWYCSSSGFQRHSYSELCPRQIKQRLLDGQAPVLDASQPSHQPLHNGQLYINSPPWPLSQMLHRQYDLLRLRRSPSLTLPL